MGKKLFINVDKLKRPGPGKKKLVNFWIEEDLYDSFNKLCEKELSQKAASEVIRAMIREICINAKYWKE